MNTDEAKFLLSALRKGDCTAAESGTLPDDIATACELLEQDSELNRWFQKNCAFDAAVAEKCAQHSAPTDLESSILAGIRVSGAVPWWRRRALVTFAAAAAIAVFAVTSWWQSDPSSPDGPKLAGTDAPIAGDHLEFRQAMISEIESVTQLDFDSDEPHKIDEWIISEGSPAPKVFDTPDTIGGAPVAGCKLLNWNGHRATLICFIGENDAGDPISFHLVAIDRKALGDLPVEEAARVVAHQNSDWTTALEVASDESQVVFIATRTEADISDIRELL